MPENRFPASVAAFLSAHGGESLLSGDLADLAAIVKVFQQSRPVLDSDPLSEENRIWLSVLADCVAVTDERIYEHYRALVDLFRAGIFRAPREQLLRTPAWGGVAEKGIRLGLLPEDLYGADRPVPHVGVPVLADGKGGGSA